MTQQQLRNWYTFALRMAYRGFKGIPKKSKKRIADMVKDFFRGLKDYGDDIVSRLIDWDSSEECQECKASNVNRYCFCSGGAGDMISELEQGWNPYYWQDQDSDSYSTPYHKWNERWTSKVECCLRAGLDLASSPSAGVIGFDVCDLRRMYKDNIPKWINSEFQDPQGQAVDLNSGSCEVSIWL